MKRVSFVEAAMAALLASLLAGLLYHGAMLVVPGYDAIRLAIVGAGIGYAVWLVVRSRRKEGRVVALVCVGLVSALTVLLDPPVLFYVLSQLALFWLIRVLGHHRRLTHALADIGVSLASVVSALWAMSATGSLAVAVWVALLCQALLYLFSERTQSAELPLPDLEGRFNRARRAAESALRRLSVNS